MSKKIIGIDLASSVSVVSVIENGIPVAIPNSEGSLGTPSVVAFKKDGTRLVGVAAQRQKVTNHENSVFLAKRFIGRKYSEVKDFSDKMPYKIKEAPDGGVVFEIPSIGKDVTPQEISAAIISKLKDQAEQYLGQKVDECVLTVPAHFNDAQRVASEEACRICNLNPIRIINEPTAAALAYGYDKDKEGIICILDLGGATEDCAILEIGDGLYKVLTISGNSFLGGSNFDDRIAEWVISEIKKQYGIDLGNDGAAKQRILEASEKAKCELSYMPSTSINLPYISSVDNNPIHFETTLTSTKFEQLCSDLIEKAKEPLLEVLNSPVVDKTKIKDVILVGGSTRLNCIQKMIKEITGLEPNKSCNPDLAISHGAAIQAGVLNSEITDLVLVDCVPISLGVECNGGLVEVLIPKNSSIPCSRSQEFTTAMDNQSEVSINVLQTERKMAKDAKSLGLFNLTGIAASPKGVPKILVQFDINASGVLEVKATDKATGKEQKLTISGSSNLSDEEIQRMTEDAEKYAQQDAEAKALILARNELEALCYGSEQTVESAKEKADQALLDNVTEAIAKARETLTNGTLPELEEAKTNLLNASHKLAEILYSQEPVEAQVV